MNINRSEDELKFESAIVGSRVAFSASVNNFVTSLACIYFLIQHGSIYLPFDDLNLI